MRLLDEGLAAFATLVLYYMRDPQHTLSFREKFAYSLGDVATNFFFQSMILYQTRFYTDTVGLSAITVGTMFLLIRGADAVFDPLVGILADRTRSQWGKFRPWVLWTAIPFGVSFWLVYRTPSLPGEAKVAYAYITYAALMLLYSANNTPYAALMGVMTPDTNERTSIATYRFVAAMSGQLVIQALALPLVDKFGGGNTAHGWSLTMALFGSVMACCYVITFLGTRERVIPNPLQRISLKSDLRSVLGCRPWIAMFALTLMIFAMHVIRGSATNYLFVYYLDPQAILMFLGNFGLNSAAGNHPILGALGLIVKSDASNAASVGLSLFLVSSVLVQIIGVLLSKPLADRFGKKPVFLVGLAITATATAMVVFVKPTQVTTFFLLFSVLWPLGWGPTIPLLWVMIADVADFSEWKSSRRATGFMYAGILFALKAGLGIGGAISGWLMAIYQYVPNVAQSAQSLLGIRLSASLYAAVPLVIGLVCLAFYPISKRLGLQIQHELMQRRAGFTG